MNSDPSTHTNPQLKDPAFNPLLAESHAPRGAVPFQLIKNEQFLPAFEVLIAEGKQKIKDLKVPLKTPTFENTLAALEEVDLRLNLASSIFFNLLSCETNEELQKIAKVISPLLTDYSNDIALDAELFKGIEELYEKKSKIPMDQEARELLERTYRSFIRNGAKLDDAKKEKLRELDKQSSELKLQFEDNVLKATNAFELHITDKEQLRGMPDGLLEAAHEEALSKGKKEGYLFTLAYPSFVPFMKYVENRELRKKMYMAFGSRAFKQADCDNQEIVKKIALLRHERAQLLGYATHAHFVLEERMAETPQKVTAFLKDFLKAAKPHALQEMEELAEFQKRIDGVRDLQKWDYAYYAEKLRKEKYAIDDEILRPYFPLEQTISGMFQVASELYGLKFLERNDIPVYHPDVKVYEVYDVNDPITEKYLGLFYADFFPREGKRSGAWMTNYKGQMRFQGPLGKHEDRPHVSIVCNFTKPTQNAPSLLTFSEVTTLFHEFGHSLHSLLSDCQFPSLSGTNVYWDFVELPSQILENWCYEKKCLDLFAKHYQTGEKIPEELIEKIRRSANFHSGYFGLRQLSFALIDMGWHGQDPSTIKDLQAFEANILSETDLLPKVEGTNSSCSFSHIFAGGYSAGYYSYKWAEVLDADAFELFQEKGIFNKDVARKFRENILSRGGSTHPSILYQNFRGRGPDPKALLKRSGLI